MMRYVDQELESYACRVVFYVFLRRFLFMSVLYHTDYICGSGGNCGDEETRRRDGVRGCKTARDAGIS